MVRKAFKPALKFGFVITPLFGFIGGGVMATSAQTQNQTARGTVNIVLANAAGIVVLTDSKQTILNAAGEPIGSQYAQKLVRLDDRSVCAIAGFANVPFLKLDIMGILADFGKQLATQKRYASFDEKLRTISHVIDFYMNAYANTKEFVQPGQRATSFEPLHIFIAGFDNDEHAKIGSMELEATPVVLSSQRIRWEFREKIQLRAAGNPVDGCRMLGDVQYCAAGITDVADNIMRNPQPYARIPAVTRFLNAGSDKNAQLSLGDLEALAVFLSTKTSDSYAAYVGGPNQIATLHDGKILEFEEAYASPPAPMPVSLVMDNTMKGANGGIEYPKGMTMIWIRDTIIGHQGLVLDGSIFLGTEIRDSIVTYAGGTTSFDSSNKVTNSELEMHTPVGSSSSFMHALSHDFPWTRCVPIACGAY